MVMQYSRIGINIPKPKEKEKKPVIPDLYINVGLIILLITVILALSFT